MRTQLAGSVVDLAFGKDHGFGSEQQQAFGHQVFTFADSGRPHETRFHLNGDHTHVGFNAACSGGHDDIKQRHDGAAMGDVK